MGKIVVLTFNKEKGDKYILEELNAVEGISAFPVLRDVNFFEKCVRRINFTLLPRHIDQWLSKTWKNQIKSDDIVICMAAFWSPTILKRIKSKFNCRCINYYWDKINVAGYPVIYDKAYENWTFDLEDSKLYQMKYNPQFYVNDIQISNRKIKYDVMFVGADRNGKLENRVKMANECYRCMKKMGLTTYFHLLTNSDKADREIVHHESISMRNLLQIMRQSKSVLELVEPNEEWLTLRPFQALSNNVKLITNNKKIADYDFYSQQNIFVIGEDRWEDLAKFLNSPFEYVPALENYSVYNWRDRFVTG